MASFENQVNAGQNLLARPARRDRAPPQPEGKGKRMARIFIRRVYDAPAPDEGQRVLVDRLWPRGISHERLGEDTPWLKAIAPSDELRHWFDHDPAKWPEFQRRYAGVAPRILGCHMFMWGLVERRSASGEKPAAGDVP